MIYAMIDIGSNTVRLAVYHIDGTHIEQVMKKKDTTVALASFVKDNVMERRGIERLIYTLKEYLRFLRIFCIDHYSAFATGSLRNCVNREEAIEAIRRETGIEIRIITGDEEAGLDFVGATHDLEETEGLLVDIGGASTEIVHYESGAIEKKISLPIGSLFLASSCVEGILPVPAEVESMRKKARDIISTAVFEGAQGLPVCGIGGTYKGACAMHAALGRTGPMTREDIDGLIARFGAGRKLSEADTILLMRSVPDRMHTVIPGLVIASEICGKFASEIVRYSDSGVREGFLYSEVIG
ncbi:hypothetical protein TAMA11512_00130 [Selenomonas sp. TAMA-11512]|uniref:Ppx/GppA phosphatase family protein n=1 Tax=Selenomonas sp. TAMA-11512 TaxID=3095337 RepID=UPI00308834AC|nr:hypothetical protein TAMA11512_00130 [Selenomonas sp. TAMA-11512]